MRAERKHFRNRDASCEARDHDFEVIDSVVTGTATAEPEDAALTSFALAVKSAKPEPGAGFSSELDERMERLRLEGKREASRSSVWRQRRGQLVTVGCVAVLFGAAVTITGLTGGEDDSAVPQSAQMQSSEAAPERAAPLSGGPATQTLSTGPRDVIRDASVSIGTGPEEFTSTTDEIIAITDRMGGYVLNSSVGDGTQAPSAAQLSLMVPESKFQAALAEISSLGTVLERTQSSEDVTSTVSRIDRRVASARDRREELLEQLKAATTDQQRAAIRAELRRADARLRNAVNAQREVERKVRYSSISATVTPSAASEDSSAIDSAWSTAKSVLEFIVAGSIVVLAIALPIGLLALAALLATRWWRRRTRDRAIDSADSAPGQTP